MLFANKIPAIACLVLLVASGCSGKPERHAVTGVIEIGGKPLDDASVIFTPIGTGLSGVASVEDGKFACSVEGGPSVGKFHIRLSPNEAEMEEVEANPRQLATNRRRPKVPRKYQVLGGIEVEITGLPDQVITLDLKR